MSFKKFREEKGPGEAPSAATLLSSGPAVSAGSAILDRGTQVVGTLTFEGAAEIHGSVEGEIISKGKLVIGETAIITAKVQAKEIIIKGTLKGDVVASDRLALRKPARVSGNISSVALSVEEGVLFEGSCKMLQQSSVKKEVSNPPANGSSSTSKGTGAAPSA